jgi:hypothetical protein
MAGDSFLKLSRTSSKIEKNADRNLSKTSHLIENFDVRKCYEWTANEGDRELRRN